MPATATGQIEIQHAAARPWGAETKAIHGMASCRRCKAALRVEGVGQILKSRDRFGNERREVREHWPQLSCSCGRQDPPSINRIRGVVTDHVCDARCTGATGHVCECSCGGKNHGSDWS